MEKVKPEKNKANGVSLKKIGNFIKEARISRDQSIVGLAADLKISAHQLKAIEDGREDLLPEKVFIKAMVKRISEKLKLDTKFIIREFENQTKEVIIDDLVEEVSNKTKIKQKSHIRFIPILISGIIGLLASSFILNIFFSPQNQSENFENIKNN